MINKNILLGCGFELSYEFSSCRFFYAIISKFNMIAKRDMPNNYINAVYLLMFIFFCQRNFEKSDHTTLLYNIKIFIQQLFSINVVFTNDKKTFILRKKVFLYTLILSQLQ